MRQIIAMGGGGFSMEPDNLALDRYVLEQTSKARPKVCFLPTASDNIDSYCVKFYDAFSSLDCYPSYLSLFHPPSGDLESFIMDKDVIYVGGGNTKSMLALWREWGLDSILRRAWQNGTILTGLSAGAICWFEQGVSDSIPGQFIALPCLGFLRGSCCPHYDGEAQRRPTYRQLLAEGKVLPGLALDDGAAAHFVEDQLSHVVSSRPNARAYLIEKVDGEVAERPLASIFLLG